MKREQRLVTAAQERLELWKLEEAKGRLFSEGSGGSPDGLTHQFPTPDLRVVRVNFCSFSHPVVVLSYDSSRKPAKLGRDGEALAHGGGSGNQE